MIFIAPASIRDLLKPLRQHAQATRTMQHALEEGSTGFRSCISGWLSQMIRCPENKNGFPRSVYPENRVFESPEIWNYDYPITGYGTVCMPDDSDKAWGMLFESEAWPLPFRVK